MSKHIDLLLTGPPDINFPTFVGAQDELGAPVKVGQWIEPDADMPFWRFRLTPAELLMYMIADADKPMLAYGETHVEVSSAEFDALRSRTSRNRPASDRAALKAKLAGAKPKQPAAAATAPPATPADPLATDRCPACRALFNPALDQLFDCPACGESKCTARCFGSVADPCLDCQALHPTPGDPEDAAFEPEPPPRAEISTPELRAAMQAETRGAAQAVGNRLFDGAYHGKGGDSSPAADEDDE